MTSLGFDSVAPDAEDAAAAERALEHVRSYLGRHPDGPETIELRVEGDEAGESLVVPRSALELFVAVLAHMAIGSGVAVVPAHAELTTQQAADLLNVSRPFLIGRLETGAIEYRMVGSHRRVKMASLREYQREDDRRRGEKLDELIALRQEMELE